MSNIVSAIVQKRRVGSPTRKAILMFMASCASDNGEGVWCSKATMARDLELVKRTVQKSIDALVEDRLIVQVGTRRCAHGFTVEYRMNIEAIRQLEPTNPKGAISPKSRSQKADISTDPDRGELDSPVQEVHPTRAGDSPHGVQEIHPNRTGTVLEPVCGDVSMKTDKSPFLGFWGVYPRLRDRPKSERLFEAAVSAGIDPLRIIAAAKAYGVENAQNIDKGRKQYLAYSDNWLEQRRWEDGGSQASTSAGIDLDGHCDLWVGKIRQGKPIASGAISPVVASAIVERGMLTEADLIKAGVRL